MTEDSAGRLHGVAAKGAVKDQRPEIAGYDILEKLEASESAVTWKARQQSLDRVVTVKVLKPKVAATPAEATRFEDEARAIAQLKGSGLIHVYDVNRYRDAYCFIMEYVEGEALSALLQRDRNLSQKKALDIALAVAEVLDSCWQTNKVAHLDVQPDNIVLSADQLVKLANFGMARLTQGIAAGDHAGRGNAYYMAPERSLPDAKPDFRADMYSLGAVLYHMLTGAKPFDGQDRALVAMALQEEQIPDPRDVNPGLSVGVTQLVARLMMKEPHQRYGSWAAAITAIKKVQAGKVLLHKQGRARSTIAVSPNVGSVAQASVPKLGAARAGTAARATASSAASYPMLRLMLRAGLIAWLVGLGYLLLGLPPKPELTRQRPALTPGDDTPVVPTAALPPSPTTPPPTEPHPPPTLEPPPTDVAPVPNHAPLASPRVDGGAHPAIDAVAQDVAQRLLAEDYAAALSIAERALQAAGDSSEKAGLQTLREIAAYLVNLDANLQEAFRKRIGIPSDLNHTGMTATIEITEVNGDKVTADLITRGASVASRRNTVFRISTLDPREQARWLGSISSPTLAVAHYVLAMQAGDFLGAQAAAAQAGPLAAVLSDQVEARIRLLTE
jgi:eukaryotic-like serine/threonine-protein kinase